MHNQLAHNQIVLLGAGHTNAHILRMWRMNPIHNARLICISDFPFATYSGMVPGVLAGQYTQDQMEIDLVRACRASGARLVLDPVQQIDVDQRQIVFVDRPNLPFDFLSIGTGSVPDQSNVDINSDRLVEIKPMQTFLSRLDAVIERARTANEQTHQPLRATVVGGGAGGVEISLCLAPHLKKILGSHPFEIRLIQGGPRLAGGVSHKTESRIREAMQQHGIDVRLNTNVTAINDRVLSLDDATNIESDVILWATNAVASEQLKAIDLPHDDRGFLQIRSTLQSIGSDHVFAVGDSGTIVESPTPKAGVYAVRQGKILWENLRRSVEKKPLLHYKPQSGFLKLLNTGDGKAIGEYRGRSFRGNWVFRLKDRIDRKFMLMHQDYQLPKMAPPILEETEMKCQGCGGKVGGATLSSLLERLNITNNESVLIGLDQPDDAALIKSSSGKPLAISTDYFTSPLDDPYLVGRIGALNAASDIYATGARPTVALAITSVPEGHPREQEQLLFELLSGSLREFDEMGVSLVGGHTIEADQLTIGFTVVGEQIGERAAQKANLNVGDCLVMTQPLGIGILLAAWMQAKCRHAWYPALVETIVINNGKAMQSLEEISFSTVTDITGFGLAGHLYEMAKASQVCAELELNRITLLPGVQELVDSGLESTLAPANRWIEPLINCPPELKSKPEYRALFDPQTNGGMLIGVPPDQLDRCLEALQNGGFESAVQIGRVKPRNDDYLIEIGSG